MYYTQYHNIYTQNAETIYISVFVYKATQLMHNQADEEKEFSNKIFYKVFFSVLPCILYIVV